MNSDFGRLLFLDTETTGFSEYDRVVSLAAFSVAHEEVMKGQFRAEFGYFIFDPQRRSHPRAEAVHGFDDWTLRHQDYFLEVAGWFVELFERADTYVGHNLQFDLGFLRAEFSRAGLVFPERREICTLQYYRDEFPNRSGTLDNVIRNIGLKRRAEVHSALEDVWLTFHVFCWLWNAPRQPIDLLPIALPNNWQEPPPRPIGRLPMRRKRSAVIRE